MNRRTFGSILALSTLACGSACWAQVQAEPAKPAEKPVQPATKPAATPDQPKEVSAKERLAAVREVYRTLKTYRDEGTITSELKAQGRTTTSEMPFATAFERGGRFRWQFRHGSIPGHKPDQRYTIWSKDGKSFDSFWTLTGQKRAEQSIDMALAGPTGISSGGATAINVLLEPPGQPSNWGIRLTDLDDAQDAGQEEIDGKACRKIVGKMKWSEGKCTLWIDAQNLIRKVQEEAIVDPAKLPAPPGQPANAPKGDKFVSLTTMVFRPVINEAKIDDATFLPDEKEPERAKK